MFRHNERDGAEGGGGRLWKGKKQNQENRHFSLHHKHLCEPTQYAFQWKIFCLFVYLFTYAAMICLTAASLPYSIVDNNNNNKYSSVKNNRQQILPKQILSSTENCFYAHLA